MTEPLKCDKCGNTPLTLLTSNIQGLNKVVDIYFCRKCQTGKTVITMRQETFIEHRDPDLNSYGDVDGDYSYETTQEPENPYEDDDDGGWDPSIG